MELNVWFSMLLGLVQGLAEFLPISSSGHLVIFRELFHINVEDNLAFDTVLHLGSLFAILFVYREDVVLLMSGFFKLPKQIININKEKLKSYSKTKEIYQMEIQIKQEKLEPYSKMVIALIIATIPAIFAALFFEDFINSLFNSALVVGIMLYITAILLFVSDKVVKGNANEKSLKYSQALFVGVCQMLAIAPGLSRSGTTMVAGIFSGFEKQFAVKFAFLMAIPAIVGAAVFNLKDIFIQGLTRAEVLTYLSGGIVSFFASVVAITFLNKFVKKGKLSYFSFYCILAGTFAIILYFIK